MKSLFKKALVAFAAVGMMLWLLPVVAFADEDICQIVGSDGIVVQGYDDFGDALDNVEDGQTIKLLTNITYYSGIVITGKSITFNVNGFTLRIESTNGTNSDHSIALEVGAGGEVLLNDSAGGILDCRGGCYAVYAHNGGKATVTNTRVSGNYEESSAVYATGVGSTITAKGYAWYGWYSARATDGGTVTVHGTTNGGGGVLARGVGTTVIIGGDSHGGGTAVNAGNGAVVHVLGYGHSAGTIGVFCFGGAEVTIDKGLNTTATATYVRVDSINKSKDQHEPVSGKISYDEYRNNDSIVWIGYLRIIIITHPEDLIVFEGAITESLYCEAELSNLATPTYQWYSNTSASNVGGTLIAGATSSTFPLPTTLTKADSPYYYYCVASGSTEVFATSDVATVTVVALQIAIITHPEDLTVTEGAITESLYCEAKMSNLATPTYQWYSNTSASNVGGTLIPGATSSTFPLPTTLTKADSPYYYYCVATGNANVSLTSNAATVTVIKPGESTLPPTADNALPVICFALLSLFVGSYSIIKSRKQTILPD
ncbi:MAG: hypothetical protein FWD45_00600 [Coriobacteriia bacterium]|nr:hypothetical protein [Coriobacteriia bacterium]